MERKWTRGRWAAIGLVVGLGMAWGGLGLASGAPTTITTCTKTKTGKMKVIAASDVAKCTKKGKGTATAWDDHGTTVALTNQLTATQGQLEESQDETAAAERYHDLLFGSVACNGVTNDFRFMNLRNVFMPICLAGADLSHSDLYRATLTYAALANANLSSANLEWANLEQAVVWNANLSGANLSLANLSDADFTGANLSGVTWGSTMCPDYTISSTNGTSPQSCFGHGPGL
jgi:hypothetical protein